MTDSAMIPWSGIGVPDIDPATPIRPVYRGAEAPALIGRRITCAPAARMDWSHDGGPDDIVGYRLGIGGDAFEEWIAPFVPGEEQDD